MVNTAVILAAGLGTRLGKISKDKPKGFLQIDGITIIEMSISKLLEAGIENIIIGTGFLQQEFKKLSLKYPQIKCIYNGQYAKTGSLYTLYRVSNAIFEDFILLESDLIYDKEGLKTLINHNSPDVILASSLTNTHDEVFIETDENHCLAKISKNKDELKNSNCEFTGITKISRDTFKMMCDFAEKACKKNPKADYEEALADVSKNMPIHVERVEDFKWCEIDDEEHLHRAVNQVYPMIQIKELIQQPVKRNVLLNPGPATTSDSVKYAQIVPDICPREKEFGRVMKFISDELVKFAGNPKDHAAVLFCGSGTAAVESILSSVIGQDSVLVINNGAYGKRMVEIAQIYGLKCIEFKSSSFNAIDLKELEYVIKSCPEKISHLAVVHCETTTGLLNDVGSIGVLCQKYGIKMLVDAMSSFAALPVDMKKMNINCLAASSNKNLQGMAGVSFVIADKNSLEASKYIKPRNYYLNLYQQYKYFLDNHQMRFTPPVQTLYALKEAIIETQLEGIEKRYERYSNSWETLIDGITRLGLSYLVNRKDHSKIITAIVEPVCPNYNFEKMHDFLHRRGITIYPGKLDTFNTFRVANIGDITSKDIEKFLELLGEYLESIGYVV